jgi:hypothetical protein
MAGTRWHRRRQTGLTHTAVVGITIALVSGLRAVLPDVPGWAFLVGGLVVAGGGFIGLWINGNDGNANQVEDHGQ